jgi:hypothetical protein
MTAFSMGGPVVVEAAHKGMVPNLLGVVVIDVVEGTATPLDPWIRHSMLMCSEIKERRWTHCNTCTLT